MGYLGSAPFGATSVGIVKSVNNINPDGTGNVGTIFPAVRQTIQNGPVSFLMHATGLSVKLNAGVGAVIVSFAAGWNQNGQVDVPGYFTTDTYFTSLAANNTSFLWVDRNVTTGALTTGFSLAPVQYGTSFNQSAQSKLDLNNSITDDFGNFWINNGVTFSNTSPAIAGTYMGVFNGTSSYMLSPAFTSMGQGSWTMRCKCKPAALPANGTSAISYIFNGGNVATYGPLLGIYNNSGSIKFVIYLSSTGSSWDIASAVVGTTTPVVGTSYDVELTFDGSTYRLYVNGIQEISVVSSLKLCPITAMGIGANSLGSSGYFTGSIQGFEFLPYCVHPAGTTFTPSTTLASLTTFNYASDFFNIKDMKMYQIVGPSTVAGFNPVMASGTWCYIGECITNASFVGNITEYAYNGKYDSGLFAVAANTSYSKSHNLGNINYNLDITMADDSSGTNEHPAQPAMYTGSNFVGYYGVASSRNISGVQTAAFVGFNAAASAASSSFYRIRARRTF